MVGVVPYTDKLIVRTYNVSLYRLPESRVGSQTEKVVVWVVVEVDRGHTGREDIDDPHCDDPAVQPVLLME